MKKIIILLLCCGVLVSMVGCGGNTTPPPTESPPTTISETIMTETPTETTPPVTAVKPTEKEKESLPTVSKDQATEPTVTATEPTTTAKPTEETKRAETTKETEPSAAENIESKVEDPPKEEEIYVGIQWPEVDPADIERLVVEKVNAYRIAQGDTAATMLPGLTEVARYRANELTTNFSHTSPRDACGALKYGEFIDMTLYVSAPKIVITKASTERPSVWVTGSARRKACPTESQTVSIIAKDTGRMSAAPSIPT